MDTGLKKIVELEEQLNGVIRGKAEQLRCLLTVLLAGGHVLLEDVPGTGKSTLAKALARSLDCSYNRVQFTPDLLPTDIIGGMIFSPSSGDFYLRKGPVFSHILLADEINRASPRTQSALLEAMGEQQVSIDNETYPLPPPFMVIATQNPIEHNGTFPLPEAQLDRFCMRLTLGYPEPEEELKLFGMQRDGHPVNKLKPVIGVQDLLDARAVVRQVQIEETVQRYALDLICATRNDSRVVLGAGTRALLDLLHSAQALAWMDGRDFVRPDDLRQLAVSILAHRLKLQVNIVHSGTLPGELIHEIMASLKPPV